MNKRQLCTALLALCGSMALALPAFAQDSQAGSATATATASTQQQAAPGTQAKQRVVPSLDSRSCIRDTGSHIPPPKGKCLPVAGRSYSQKDIQRTGAVDVGHALQMLDPSITVHGH
ncbi:MAG TPA: hypothetical protein VFY97_09930 [Rhodanobacteraceae bacterium]|nr:hypothetical protein [Rhodanobacteraceae bacterium]